MVVNLVNKCRREHYWLGTAHGIKTLITVSKPEDLCYPVHMVELEEKRADDVIQARAQAATSYHTGARPLRVEKQFRTRPCKFK